MARFLAIYLCVLLGFTSADAEFVKYGKNSGYGTFALVQIKAKKQRSRRSAKRHSGQRRNRSKSRSFRHSANRPLASDWDAVIRRNSLSKTEGESQGEMLPEEYRQWMRNLNDQELDLYLKFRVTDAIPFAEVEAEAKRRKVR